MKAGRTQDPAQKENFDFDHMLDKLVTIESDFSLINEKYRFLN